MKNENAAASCSQKRTAGGAAGGAVGVLANEGPGRTEIDRTVTEEELKNP